MRLISNVELSQASFNFQLCMTLMKSVYDNIYGTKLVEDEVLWFASQCGVWLVVTVSWSKLCCAIKQDTSLCGYLFCRMGLIIPADLIGRSADLSALGTAPWTQNWGRYMELCVGLIRHLPWTVVLLILLTLDRVCLVFWGKWMCHLVTKL